MESPQISKRNGPKGKTNFIARNRTKAAKTVRRGRGGSNNDRINERQGGNRRRKYRKQARGSGYGGNSSSNNHNVYLHHLIVICSSSNNNNKMVIYKYNTKAPLKEAMGSHHSQVMQVGILHRE